MKQSAATLHRPGRFFAIAALLLPATVFAQAPAAKAPAVRLRPAAELTGAADLRAASAASRGLASADFDEDGVPDLVTGYATADGGRVTVQRGNIDAIYPTSADAKARKERGEFTAAAFHPAQGSLAIAEAADFVGAGDFDADGHWDVVAAARGGTTLYWLRGDGRGNFAAPASVDLGGKLTAFTTGEANRVDGLADLAVGIATAEGARVLVFEGPGGALRHAPESFAVSAAVNDVAFGNPRAPFLHDLAIASGNEVVMVEGRDRKLSLNAEAQARVALAEMSRTAFPAAVVSVAFGDFNGDAGRELAVLTADNQLHVGENVLRLAAESGRDIDVATAASSNSAAARLMRAKISTSQKHDLLVFGGASAVQLVTAGAHADGAQFNTAQLAIAGATAVLPMRLNSDALDDLVLTPNGGSPSVMESHGGATFVVNTTARTRDDKPGDGICADAAGACSFAAAIEESNAHAGADTIHFNIPGGGVPSVGGHVPGIVFSDFYEPITIDGTTQPGGRVEIDNDGYPAVVFYGDNSVLRGVATYSSSWAIVLASSNNIIEGNFIGFRADGSKPPESYGVHGSGVIFRGGVNSSRPGNNNLLGGTTAQARNVFANCREPAYLPSTTGNVLIGNYFGTTPDGTAVFSNFNAAIRAFDSDVIIGGTAAGAGNLIAGTSPQSGAVAVDLSKAALVQGNLVGTNKDGTQIIPNGASGIYVGTNELVTIGGTTPAARNVIAGNAGDGLVVPHNSGAGALIQGNYIGTNAAGTGALPNGRAGISLSGTLPLPVGGTAPGAGNLLSGNGQYGLQMVGGINGTPCRGVVVQGNRVGTDVSGTIALPNLDSGMYLEVMDNGQIGGTTAAERNVVSGNGKDGIASGDAPANISRIQGNLIGVNVFGTGALGNGRHGVHVVNVGGHQIGGNEPGAGNLIAFNGGAGIASTGRDFLGGAFLSNSIFANRGLGLDSGGDGPTSNDNRGYSHTPVITFVNTNGSETFISGELRTTTFGPQGPYTIQFFSNAARDPSGHGEGETFIGQTTITAGQNVTVPFSATITPAVPPGRYISAVAIGVHNTQHNGSPMTSEFSFAVRVPGDTSNTPLQVSALTPSVGGDTGRVTVTISGQGIREGATVLLRRAGQPDIVGTVVSISSDGSTMEATFDLTGQALGGGYEIVIGNRDGTSSSLQNAFTVEAGRGARVFVNLTGPPQIRVGGPARYFLTYGNTGNVDSEASLVRVFVPSGYEIGPRARLEDGSFPAVYPSEGETVVQFYLARIAPGASSTVIHVRADRESTADTALRAAVITSPTFRAAAEAAVDPTVQLEHRVLESRADYQKTEIQITTPQASGSLIREITKTPVSEHQDLTATIVETEDLFERTYKYTLPQSVVDPVAVARAQRREDMPAGGDSSAIRTDASGGGNQTTAAAVSATSIRPNKGGGTITTTIYGQGLHSGMNVKLTRAGERDVYAGGVSAVREGLSALVYFDLRRVALGLWNVEVIGTDGSTSRLPNGFEVVAAYVEVKDTTRPGPGVAGGTARELNDKAQEAAEGKNNKPPPPQPPPPPPGQDSNPPPASTPPPPPPPPSDDTVKPQQPGPHHTNREIRKPKPSPPVPPPAPAPGTSPKPPPPPPEVPDRQPDGGAPYLPFQPPTPPPSTPTPPPSPAPSPSATPLPLPEGGLGGLIRRIILLLTPRFSFDPNDKIGPQGAGGGRFISGLEPMSYMIQFENKASANAPAQDVVITDQLDVTKFDLSSFQLGPISFGPDINVAPPPGLSEWTTDIDLRPANNLIVRVSGLLDKTTGVITWRFISLDPATLQPTEDAAAGFLPPNTTAPEGEGAVLFTISPKPNLPEGTQIRNRARIVFDVNAPIDTPEWSNTIDNTPPTSAVQSLAPAQTSSLFEVKWSGSDPGSGVSSYIIYVSENGGPFRFWIETSATSAFFQGRPNANYSFFSVARDGAGIYEEAPGPADASTITLAGQLLNISTRMRVQGGDNVLIGGMIVTGNDPKRVILRALGGSLAANVPGALQDPVLELYQAGELVAFNDNWRDSQQGEIEGSTIPPTNELESAIVHTLTPGFYTAVMKGKDGGTGIGVVEAYDLDQGANSKLANISSRGFVEAGDNAMIGGVIAGGNGGGDTRVLIRAIGPSLETAGITGALQDPTLELRDPNGALVRANDNWQDQQQADIIATTIPPAHAAESAIVATLPPGFYTAIVRGKNNGTGIALVEVYNVP